jgi:hypothetical protein
LVRRIAPVILVFGFATWVAAAFGNKLAPTLVGSYRNFFSRCAAIEPGSTGREVLVVMRGYVLAQRDGNRIVDAALIGEETVPSRERVADESYLFYPTNSEPANWCVVYFQRGRVVRSARLPD